MTRELTELSWTVKPSFHIRLKMDYVRRQVSASKCNNELLNLFKSNLTFNTTFPKPENNQIYLVFHNSFLNSRESIIFVSSFSLERESDVYTKIVFNQFLNSTKDKKLKTKA